MSTTAWADPLLPKLTSRASVEQALGGTWIQQTEHQAMRRGLLESRLLETLNRIGITPTKNGRFDASPFVQIALASLEGRKYTVALDGSGTVRYVLVRIPIRIEGSPWVKDRLRPLKKELSSLSSYRLRKHEKDRYGNAFVWKGRGLWTVYLPIENELRLLLAR